MHFSSQCCNWFAFQFHKLSFSSFIVSVCLVKICQSYDPANATVHCILIACLFSPNTVIICPLCCRIPSITHPSLARRYPGARRGSGLDAGRRSVRAARVPGGRGSRQQQRRATARPDHRAGRADHGPWRTERPARTRRGGALPGQSAAGRGELRWFRGNVYSQVRCMKVDVQVGTF